METSGALSLKSCPWIGFERIRKKPNGSLRFSTEERSLQKLNLWDLKSRSGVSIQSRPVALKISCSYEKAAAPAVESESSYTSVDEALIFKYTVLPIIAQIIKMCEVVRDVANYFPTAIISGR